VDKEALKKAWERFTEGKDFKLNPDDAHVDMVATGVLENKGKYGMTLCPCRLRDGTKERDLELVCPCKFKEQKTWKDEGMCWCGLFFKR
jgi:ferredoxin-thioredoxin reductase catalytic subunit